MGTLHRSLSTEDQCVRINVIDAWEALGYRGVGREEHSGENAPADPPDLNAELADNDEGQLGRGSRRPQFSLAD
jgi:hypothetical protein